MKNKLFLSALALAVATPVMVQPIQADAAAIAFKDVPNNYYTHKEIMNLVNRSVINGFSDGTFKPTKQVTRAEFAAFIARALELPAATSNFKDVPKTAALYDGVSRANKAGIIKGFSNGTFKPNTPVNRQDMAVMLDRAMQLKGSYTKSKTMPFNDKGKVGAYAKTSVERLYNYNVMGAMSGSTYQPTTIGTRAETAKYIYNMLTVVEGGTIATPKPTPTPKPPVANKHYKDMTLAELKATYPQHNHIIVSRQWKDPKTKLVDMKIITTDMMEKYYEQLHDPRLSGIPEYIAGMEPNKWFKGSLVGGGGYAGIYIDYPMREVISYNGKSYKDSALMPDNFNLTSPTAYETMPSQPAEKGQFLIDIHRYDNDFATYRYGDVKTAALGANPVEKSRVYPVGNEYIVDMATALKDATGVSMAKGGLEIAYNDKKIILSNGSKQATVNGQAVTLSEIVTVKNGVAYAPIREVVEHIGLYTRVSHLYKRFEIANFPLTHKIGLWLE